MTKTEQALTRGSAQTDLVSGFKAEESAELATQRDGTRVRAEVEAAVVLARRFPRDESAAYAGLIRSAKRPSFAEKAMYRFPRGSSQITGPSVVMAREFARLWGNVRYGVEITRDDDDGMVLRGWAWDMETNTQTEGGDSFAKLIYRKQGGWVKPDERDLRELVNRRASFLIRNCLLSILPRDMVEDAMEEIAATLLGDTRVNRTETIKKLVVAFDEVGVTSAMLAEYLGCAVATATDEQVAELRAIYRSIRDGNSKRDEYFGRATVDATPPAGGPSVAGGGAIPPREPAAPVAAPDAEPEPESEPSAPSESEALRITLREIVDSIDPEIADKRLRAIGIAGMGALPGASEDTLRAAIKVLQAKPKPRAKATE